MGCDIHIAIEYKRPSYNYWDCIAHDIRLPRDYAFFARLAGVRGEPPESGTIGHLSKSLIRNCSSYVTSDIALMIVDCDPEEVNISDGYIDKAKAENWLALGIAEKVKIDRSNYVTHPDYHSVGYCSPDEWRIAIRGTGVSGARSGAEHKAILAMAKSLEDSGMIVRIVFWFDN